MNFETLDQSVLVAGRGPVVRRGKNKTSKQTGIDVLFFSLCSAHVF
jgi:hypothetical protein